MALWFCNYSWYHDLMVFTQIWKKIKCIFIHPKLNNKKIPLIIVTFGENNNLWSCDANMACHMAMRLTNNCNTSWLVRLTLHHDSCDWFDELISFIN